MQNSFEISLRMHLYINLNCEIQDTDDLGYTICDFLSELNPELNKITYSLHESQMNEDVPNELKILVTFYIPADKNHNYKELSRITGEFLDLLPNDISFIDERISPIDNLNFQFHEESIYKI